MKKIAFICAGIIVLCACNHRKAPDVSDIKVPLQVERFEQDFFAIDTNHLFDGLQSLKKKYPDFMQDFVVNILGLPTITDTSFREQNAMRKFISDYRSMKDSADRVFRDFDEIADEVRQGLQYVKYYFPQYRLPAKLITFIGPIDGFGDVITPDALAVGLQLHMGKGFSIYNTELGQSLYPAYISRRFTPPMIPVNCMKNILEDMFPDQSMGSPLVIQMVEKGKRLYLLDKLLPYTPDSLKTGYTAAQMKGCFDHEGLIWNYFLTNGLVYNNDPSQIKDYIGEAPNSPIGEASPGNIGMFVGWQIVKKYMAGHPEVSLTQLMRTNPKTLFEESHYKPK